jgi:hypothetical protein
VEDTMENYKGIIFKEKFAKLASKRKITIFISSENYKKYIGEELLVISGKKAFALVNLAKAISIDIKTFTAQFGRHGITEEERKKWWGKKRKFYSYRIRYIENYSPEIDISYEKNKGIFINNVIINSKDKNVVEEFGEEDIESVVAMRRGSFDAPKHPLATTLDDLIGHVDDKFVADVLNEPSGNSNQRERAAERNSNRPRSTNPKSMKAKVERFRESVKRGGVVRVEEPKNVTKIRNQVKSMSLQERFRKKLGGN